VGFGVESLEAQFFAVRFPCRREAGLSIGCLGRLFIGQGKLLDGSQCMDVAAAFSFVL